MLKKLKILFLLSLCFISLSGLCQEESEVINDDEATIEELESSRHDRLEKVQAIQETTEAIQNMNPLEQIQALGYKQLDAAALMDKKVQVILQKMFSDGLMNNQSPEVVREMILDKASGSFWEKLFKRYPKILDIFVDILRDREAFPGLIGIMGKSEDLKTYFYIWLAIIVFGILIRKKYIKKKWPFMKRFFVRTSINLSLSVVSLYIFYKMFQVEVGPTVRIIAKHF